MLGLLKEVEGYIFSYIYSLKNVEEVRTKKSHIHILESETLSEDPELLKLHKRLSIQSLIIVLNRPISTYVNTYIILVGK